MDLFRRVVLKAQSRDSLRAAAKLTHLVDGQLRFVENPPTLVRLDDLDVPVDGDRLTTKAGHLLHSYVSTLSADRRVLIDRFRIGDIARKVVGVGSVGTRTWVMLLLGRDGDDPLLLQFREAQPSVFEPYVGASGCANHGQRVVEGQRLMQAASDILLGWQRSEGFDGVERDYYVRQLWDMKGAADVSLMSPNGMRLYGDMCGWTLARAHARSGDAVAVAAYLGVSDTFDRAMATFAESYADQNERDHATLATAIADGTVEALRGI
jgi:uncharacterized protein (DUF2252 family)